ncbi:efflux RND transporter periplasmic adaptor subunit [Vibrio sp. WXL103]|uniref:efflux RND transporter periplasmic adaptor subunit n=1 Tax=unclassified Vibrio TaxID=2614977 RepID=UPI003EC50C22
MSKGKVAASAILIAALSGGWFVFQQSTQSTETSAHAFRTEPVSIGNIDNRVSATGTLTAVNDVVVGAQLSGQIITVHADFNDTVEEGQLLAEIDPDYFAARVSQNKALAAKSAADIDAQKIVIKRAQLNFERAERELARSKKLYTNKSISEDTLDTIETAAQIGKLDWHQSQSQLEILKATHQANMASLEQAQIDLDRTRITAPISGFVINRTIEAGQTVASSYNTPELFTLARDLSEMEIEAYIDESDIGLVDVGQQVRYSVDAYPNRNFNGKVSQIRKAPQVNSGVISYVVIIETQNDDNSLLPGMTANLDISIESVRNTQRVTNAAVRVASRYVSTNSVANDPLSRFQHLNLSAEQKKQLREIMPQRQSSGSSMAPSPGSSSSAQRQRSQQMQSKLASILTPEQQQLNRKVRQGEISVGPLLILNNGKLETIYAQFGASDDKFSAVISPDLTGMKVVTQVRDN